MLQKRIGFLFAVGAVLLCGQVSFAQTALKVDTFVADYMKKNHVPGLSLAVVKEGKIVMAKGYGIANLEAMHRASAESVYQLASVTKQFTATGIMMLWQEGKIGLEDKITKHLSYLPSIWGEVTVHQLLNHTSGIPSYTDLPDFFENGNQRRELTPTAILKMVSTKPVDFAPGTDWHYNNTGFYLLGLLIEKVSGQKYGDFLKERIFTPLGMTQTRLNDMRAVIPNRVTGYAWEGKQIRNGEYVSPTQPFSAGALVSTVLDMAKWDAALYTEQILKQSTLKMMWTTTPLPKKEPAAYGFGWMVSKRSGHTLISHGGGIDGFSTYIARLVDDKTTIIALLNQEAGNAERLAFGVAEIYVPSLKEVPKNEIADSDMKLTGTLKEVLTEAVQGRVNSDLFEAEVAKTLVPRIQSGKEQLAGFGALQKFQLIERVEKEGMRRLQYRARFQNLTAKVTFVLNKESKIIGMNLSPE